MYLHFPKLHGGQRGGVVGFGKVKWVQFQTACSMSLLYDEVPTYPYGSDAPETDPPAEQTAKNIYLKDRRGLSMWRRTFWVVGH